MVHGDSFDSSNDTHNIWNFDLRSQKWGVDSSRIQNRLPGTNVAFDAEKQEGWYYGEFPPDTPRSPFQARQDLFYLGRRTGSPVKVETDSSLVRGAREAVLVYIGGVGEAGILVLIGGVVGYTYQWVSMMEQINYSRHLPN